MSEPAKAPVLLRTCGFIVTAIDNVHDYWPQGMVHRHWAVHHQDIQEPVDRIATMPWPHQPRQGFARGLCRALNALRWPLIRVCSRRRVVTQQMCTRSPIQDGRKPASQALPIELICKRGNHRGLDSVSTREGIQYRAPISLVSVAVSTHDRAAYFLTRSALSPGGQSARTREDRSRGTDTSSRLPQCNRSPLLPSPD